MSEKQNWQEYEENLKKLQAEVKDSFRKAEKQESYYDGYRDGKAEGRAETRRIVYFWLSVIAVAATILIISYLTLN